ncbi:hypothetical protein GCM10007863_33740 [Dyella mobilis]|nr:hypothetical protein GCM10007863_33740 [Dyella mobilis]
MPDPASAATAGGKPNIVVLPGKKPAGGFVVKGKVMHQFGSFPMAMSTSLIAWPGAISDDMKTVRDAWADRDWKRVTFWTPQ